MAYLGIQPHFVNLGMFPPLQKGCGETCKGILGGTRVPKNVACSKQKPLRKAGRNLAKSLTKK